MKNKIAMMVLLFVFTVAGNAQAQEENATSIRGTWKVTSMIENGKTQLVAESMELVILEDKLRLMEDNTAQFEMKYQLDIAAAPKQVDLSIGEAKLLGIYKIKDDTMTICLSPSEARPTKFDSPEGSGFTFMIVERKR